MFDDLDPKDFEDTTSAVVASCANLGSMAKRARLLADAGLLSVITNEAAGGLGLPIKFAVPIVEKAAAGLLGFPLIETMLLARALAAVDPDLAKQISEGELLVTVAWTGVAEDKVVADAPMVAEADRVLIFRADGSAVLTKTGVSAKPEAGASFDIDAPEALVRLSGPLEGVILDAGAVQELHANASVLRAAFVLGSAAQCLALAVEYAQDRFQFGSRLSGYQVLRHRMARDALAVEILRTGIARAVAEPAEGAALARDAVWLAAARSGPVVAESAIQIFGGMGFTWDVPLHRHLRQIRAQAGYGAAAERLETLGDALLSTPGNTWYGEIANGV